MEENMPVKKVKASAAENQNTQSDLENKVNSLEKEISKLNEALSKALSRLVELESKKEASAGCVECVDADLRKKLAQWNPKLGQRL